MKKSSFLILLAASLFALASCEKEPAVTPDQPNDTIVPDDPVVEDLRTPFVGTYDMTLVYDSVGVDGTWIPNGLAGVTYDPDHGYLVITPAADSNTVKIDGYEVFEDEDAGTADTIYFYNTTATLDADGLLHAAPSSCSNNGLNFSITYGPMTLSGDTLTFRLEEHVPYSGMDMGYIYSVTCVKR